MRLVLSIVFGLLATAGLAFADPHAEMAAALMAQIDSHPGRATLPTKQPLQTGKLAGGRNPVPLVASAKGSAESDAHANPNGLAHQAQAAANAAAGQANAAAAKSRVHPHPGH